MKKEISCGAVIARQTENGREILLIRHVNGGHWAFPKGHMEGNETESETALREIREETGREMTVYSDMPGVQLYTFNGTSGLKNKDGSDMIPHGALCLETQFYPDSVHHENFPFRYVTPEKPFESKTIYKFTVK